MTKLYICNSCHTINGGFHNGCQCDICEGYVMQEDVPKEKVKEYIAKYEKKYKKWFKTHQHIVKMKIEAKD